MTPETKKRIECELILDHTPIWAGDGYFCSKCMLRFIPATLLQEKAEEAQRKPLRARP